MPDAVPRQISIWSGSVVNIPTGWALCDGTNGTPDLRDKFIVGSGSTYAPGATGGSVNHTHNFTGDGHTHDTSSGMGLNAGGDFEATSSQDPSTGTTDNGNVLPPYYSLAYIMFL